MKELGGIYSTAKLVEMCVIFHPGGNDWGLEP